MSGIAKEEELISQIQGSVQGLIDFVKNQINKIGNSRKPMRRCGYDKTGDIQAFA